MGAPTVRNLTLAFLLCSGLAAVAIAGWFLFLTPSPDRGDRPGVVPANCREIAWLAPATSSLGWQRLVAGAQLSVSKGAMHDCELDISGAFPADSATVPEFRFSWKSKVLIWRWYRLDEEHLITTNLLLRNPPPIAIVGGSSTDSARRLADRLGSTPMPPGRGKPVLMLTTATADFLSRPGAGPAARKKLMGIHEGMTFRAGFSNRHMAGVVIDFLKTQSFWSGPLPAPWVMRWDDDPYATDLMEAFHDSWNNLPPQGRSQADLLPAITIRSSVGGQARPNADEVSAASLFADRASKFTNLESNWLVLCGQVLPSRRLLKHMSRETESRLRGLTVAAGDTLGFNTVYRDWQELWPSIDLPYRLVFFCHQNPADESAGFARDPSPANRHLATGTEDLLLDRDIIQSLMAGWMSLADASGPEELAKSLRQLRYYPNGPGLLSEQGEFPLLFDPEGNRMPGTGEHLVTLSPPAIAKLPRRAGQVEVWAVHGKSEPTRFTRSRQLFQPEYR